MKTYRTGPTTERLSHRQLGLDDAEAFFELNSDPRVMRFTGEPRCSSLDEARQAIMNYPDFDSTGFGRWGCVLKSTNRVIGFCGLKYLPDLDSVDIGYRLLPEYWGKGYATEACIACLEFGFTVMQLDEIIGLVLPENHASIRVMEKAGMQHERDFDYDELLVSRFVGRGLT